MKSFLLNSSVRFTAVVAMFVGAAVTAHATAFSTDFNFANDLPNAAFGEEGAGTGLTVAFDSFDNGGGEAPAIDVKWAGLTIGHVLTPVSQGPAGNSFFDVFINLDSDGTLDVSYNNN